MIRLAATGRIVVAAACLVAVAGALFERVEWVAAGWALAVGACTDYAALRLRPVPLLAWQAPAQATAGDVLRLRPTPPWQRWLHPVDGWIHEGEWSLHLGHPGIVDVPAPVATEPSRAGLFFREARGQGHRVVVEPSPREIARHRGRRFAEAIEAASRRLGVDRSEMLYHRPWDPSEDASDIDWKVSSRMDQLLTRRHPPQDRRETYVILDVTEAARRRAAPHGASSTGMGADAAVRVVAAVVAPNTRTWLRTVGERGPQREVQVTAPVERSRELAITLRELPPPLEPPAEPLSAESEAVFGSDRFAAGMPEGMVPGLVFVISPLYWSAQRTREVAAALGGGWTGVIIPIEHVPRADSPERLEVAYTWVARRRANEDFLARRGWLIMDPQDFSESTHEALAADLEQTAQAGGTAETVGTASDSQEAAA